MYAYAAGEHIAQAQNLVGRIQSAILFPLMMLMFAVAILVFFWGGFQFVTNADNDQGREAGKQHMLYGIIGLLVMISAYAILKVALNTFGITLPTP